LPDENTLRAKKNYGRDDPGRIFTEAVPSSRSSQDFAARQGVTEPRARPPETRQEQPFPTHEA